MDLYKDHTIEGRNLFPGAGFIEMVLAAALRQNKITSSHAVELVGLDFLQPLDLERGVQFICEHIFAEGIQFKPSATEMFNKTVSFLDKRRQMFKQSSDTVKYVPSPWDDFYPFLKKKKTCTSSNSIVSKIHLSLFLYFVGKVEC